MPPWFQLSGAALLVASGYVGYRGVRWVQRYHRLVGSQSTDDGAVRAPGTVTLSGTAQRPPAGGYDGRNVLSQA